MPSVARGSLSDLFFEYETYGSCDAEDRIKSKICVSRGFLPQPSDVRYFPGADASLPCVVGRTSFLTAFRYFGACYRRRCIFSNSRDLLCLRALLCGDLKKCFRLRSAKPIRIIDNGCGCCVPRDANEAVCF